MTNTYNASRTFASPHAHGGSGVRHTMVRVQFALLPATLFGFWLYGWPAFFLWLITLLSCLAFEFMSLRLMGRQQIGRTLGDGSALLTGWLLAMTLPPWAPWWVGVVGAFIAIVIGKQVFGGLGHNVFNPAMVARVALLISFPLPLTTWVAPLPLTSAAAPGFVEGLQITLGQMHLTDAMSSATLLGYAKTELSRGVDLVQALAGDHAPGLSWSGIRAGSLGESAAVLILAGGLFLLVTGVIRWQAPLGVLAGVAVPAAIAHAVAPGHYLDAGTHLLSGALMLGAFFIATDYVTSPTTGQGQLIFGLGVGLITWVIRSLGGYPEGVAFAILLMNALTPIIDRYTKPRILGRTRAGRPIDPPPVGKGA
ncbi:RnfABCDGE type electron transport complex subunit D [Azovibrio restrictus]|uniref:RnfABCDGE type electron transport complex subunit D n=1 Tax=Azovibrio restrictus TaxID=146938 RepID=UPI0026EA1ACE|nr:RnfABCDGE type electron transport complex subunit D [Azovibrio restrictus]